MGVILSFLFLLFFFYVGGHNLYQPLLRPWSQSQKQETKLPFCNSVDQAIHLASRVLYGERLQHPWSIECTGYRIEYPPSKKKKKKT